VDLIERLQKISKLLDTKEITYALAGGLATSIYRNEKRTTEDLDFLLYSSSGSEKIAKDILISLNLEVRETRKASLEGGPRHAVKRNSTPACILVGRKEGEIGIDFIMPGIPCLTVEDLILAKFYSLENDASRFKDADDIQSIFQTGQSIDLSYICGQMLDLKQVVPRSVEKIVPPILLQTSKSVRKNITKDLRKV